MTLTKAKQGLPLPSSSPLKLWNKKSPISLLFHIRFPFPFRKIKPWWAARMRNRSFLGTMGLISCCWVSAKHEQPQNAAPYANWMWAAQLIPKHVASLHCYVSNTTLDEPGLPISFFVILQWNGAATVLTMQRNILSQYKSGLFHKRQWTEAGLCLLQL